MPRSYVEASTALGAARWQTIVRVILPGRQPRHRRRRRAGPRPRRRRDDDRAHGVRQRRDRLGAASPTRRARSSATIAAELAEVVFGGAHYTVLFFLGTLLFLVTFGINTVGDWAIRRMKRRLGSDDVSAPSGDRRRAADRAAVARLTARRTRRNLVADGALAVASGAALLIVLAILAVILFDVVRNGTPHLSLAVPHRGAARRDDRGRHLPGHRRHGRDGHPDDARRACRSASRPRSTCTSTPRRCRR